MYKKTCIIITGPTAVGKTDYAIDLARKYNTQIISADSRQCYRELNIGVAKPSPAQLKAIHHYFIDSHSIHKEVNAKSFEEYALNSVEKIFQLNDIAIMVGGTGLYIKAFCEGLDAIPPANNVIREEIRALYETKGMDWLTNEINLKDPLYSGSKEIRNPHRMMRALEVKLSTGKSILEFFSKKKIKRDFEFRKVHLDIPRDELYKRINNRVDEMMEAGLLKEAESLISFRHLNALKTVGYRELFNFIEGKISLQLAIHEIKKNTRHFAKRQITWFKTFNGSIA